LAMMSRGRALITETRLAFKPAGESMTSFSDVCVCVCVYIHAISRVLCFVAQEWHKNRAASFSSVQWK